MATAHTGRRPAPSASPRVIEAPDASLLEYKDPDEGFRGFLAYAGLQRPIAAGGFRVQRGLRAELIQALADDMALKHQVLGTNVDGAKCGIDYDPQSPGKPEAMRRFVRFLKPHLLGRLSLGPDMGTTWTELEHAAREEGVPSVKAAIARAQGLSERDLFRRIELLDVRVGALTVGELRAGHALAHATLEALGAVASSSARRRVAIQGFGTLGRAAALSLHEAGVVVAVVADEHLSLRRDRGIDVPVLIESLRGSRLSDGAGNGHVGRRELVFEHDVDVVVLAACEDSMSLDEAARLRARAVVVGANHGLSPAVEALLHARGIPAVPDFIGGIGGSASVDVLFAPTVAPTPAEILVQVGTLSTELTRRVLTASSAAGTAPRTAALRLAAGTRVPADSKPYGLRVLTLMDGSERVRSMPERRRPPKAARSAR